MDYFILWTLFYFIPTLVAVIRKHNNITAIFVCNVFGFTVILWFVALIWSCTNNTASHRARELEEMRRALRGHV